MTYPNTANREQNNYSNNLRILISDREREILHLIAHEYTSTQIATKLHLSPYTIHSHRKNLMSKLRVSNCAGLVRRGFEMGVLNTLL